jgi:vesicle transport through interaction with t-SNAREs protein 1
MDTSPTALFDSYEQDFLQFIEVIREKLDTTNSEDVRTGKPYCGVDEVDSPSFLDQKRSTLSRVDRELDEADEMASHPIPSQMPLFSANLLICTKVSQMELEIQSIPSSIRPQYHTRLRSAKADLQKYKKLLTDSRTQLARADLLSSKTNPHGGGYSSDDPYAASNDRTGLLAGTSILEQGTKRLQQSQQIALETETQGAEILLNLRSQREQIENSRDTVSPYPSDSLFIAS